MNIKRPLKHIRRFIKKILFFIFQTTRHLKYFLLSENTNIKNFANCFQPVIFNGEGSIYIGKDSIIGIGTSPSFYSGYSYLDAKTQTSNINIHNNVQINNNCSIISNGASIEICSYTLIGTNVSISDSDFHSLHPDKRLSSQGMCEKVFIDENVFIGSNVVILKGVNIGKNSVIANSSVVTKSFPSNSVIAGNPAKFIKELEY